MSVYVILFILFIHWIADFVLQTRAQANGKSSSWTMLYSHVGVYTIILIVFFGPVYAVMNGVAHFAVDACSSRLTKYYYRKDKIHAFFVVIGFDQFLHTAWLIWTAPYARLWYL